MLKKRKMVIQIEFTPSSWLQNLPLLIPFSNILSNYQYYY